MGQTLFWLGELTQAQAYLEQGIALYEPKQHSSLAFRYGQDPGVGLRNFAAHVLWYLGYPEQALVRMEEAVSLARELLHPFSLAFALDHGAWLHRYLREGRLTQECAEADITLSREQGFAFFLAQGTIMQGWALVEQGQKEDGIAQIRQGLAALRATGLEVVRPYWLALLAETCGMEEQVEERLHALAEALGATLKNGWRLWEAELSRIKGELLLKKAAPSEHEAETWFRQALDVARRQQAKSLELRAAMSLSRLWQGQGKRDEARKVLAEICGWFTEGFDTVDLREAKVLLDELS